MKVKCSHVALLTGLLAAVAGCGGKSATAPTPDKYAPMFGTWVGELEQQDHSQPTVWGFVDSVQVVVGPNGSLPVAQLNMRQFGRVGWQNHGWANVPFNVTGPVAENWDMGWQSYDCTFEASCGADSLNGLPASRWWGGHYLEGYNNRMHFTVVWPGVADSVGQVYLVRLSD